MALMQQAADQAAAQLLRKVLPEDIALPESPEAKWLAVQVLAHLAGDRRMEDYASHVLEAIEEKAGHQLGR